MKEKKKIKVVKMENQNKDVWVCWLGLIADLRIMKSVPRLHGIWFVALTYIHFESPKESKKTYKKYDF